MNSYIDGARTPSQQQLAGCIERWRFAEDRRALFAAALAMSVDSVMATARAGRFVESAWVERLLAQWFEYYFVTVEPEDDDLRLVTPAAWREAHSAAALPLTAPLDAVLLGVTAHITNDLPQALADQLSDEWPLSEWRLARRRADAERMLRVVADTMDGVQCLLERFDANLMPRWPRLCIERSAVHNVGALVEAWIPEVWADALALVTAIDHRWFGAIREEIECRAARRSHLLICRIPDRERLLVAGAADLDRRFPPRHNDAECRLSGAAPMWGEVAATA